MQEIQLKQVQRALTFFDALGIKYKLITPEGEEFGVLEVKPPQTRRPLSYPMGEIRNFYRRFVDLNAAIGSVQLVPTGDYSPEKVRGGVCSLLAENWGKGNYVTHLAGTNIEVMRTA
jgi:hypothetical protein